jgi:hypothetical protein
VVLDGGSPATELPPDDPQMHVVVDEVLSDQHVLRGEPDGEEHGGLSILNLAELKTHAIDVFFAGLDDVFGLGRDGGNEITELCVILCHLRVALLLDNVLDVGQRVDGRSECARSEEVVGVLVRNVHLSYGLGQALGVRDDLPCVRQAVLGIDCGQPSWQLNKMGIDAKALGRGR